MQFACKHALAAAWKFKFVQTQLRSALQVLGLSDASHLQAKSTYKESHPSEAAACSEQLMIQVVTPAGVTVAASALEELVVAPRTEAARKTTEKSLVLVNMIV